MLIEKNIPLDQPKVFRGKSGRCSAYPFTAMEIGDSVFYPDQNTETGRAYDYSQKVGKRQGKQFQGSNVEGGVRIWRIA